MLNKMQHWIDGSEDDLALMGDRKLITKGSKFMVHCEVLQHIFTVSTVQYCNSMVVVPGYL